MTITIIKW